MRLAEYGGAVMRVLTEMVKIWRLYPALLVALLLSCVQSVAATPDDSRPEAPESIRVVTDNNYPPFVFHGSDGRIQGLLVDQWRLWEQKTGIRVELTATDWNGALVAMREGRFDVIDTIFKTDERRQWLDFTHPYARLEVPVFFNKEISGITDIESLRGFAVAAKEGDAAVDLLRRHGIDNLLLFHDYEEIVRAAMEHKVNVFVVDKPPALYFLYKYGIQDRFRESDPLYVGQFHRAVSKGNTALLQTVEAGFAQISAAEVKAIERRWYGASISSLIPYRLILPGVALLLLLILVLIGWNQMLKRAVTRRTDDLRLSEERYRLLFNVGSDALLVVDADTQQLINVNEAAIELYGYSREELLALRITDLFSDPREGSRQIVNSGGRLHIPLRYHRKKDGIVFPVDISCSFFELNGRHFRLAAMRDISERMRTEQELRESRRFLGGLIENSGNLIFVKDREGCYTMVNRKWEAVTGLLRENVIGRTDAELFAAGDADQFRHHDLEVMESVQVIEQEETLDAAKGRRTFLSVKFPLFDSDGKVNGICGMVTDLTERRQAEEERERLRDQLSQRRKMESVGRLAGGIAHDFSTMIGIILGHVELALLKIKPDDQLHENLRAIENAARRSADLTRQLLIFARRQNVVPKMLDLNETVAGMLTMLGRLVGKDIEVIWRPGENIWPVWMDPSQIDQIIANLCTNSRDAIADVGRIAIATENVSLSSSFCTGHEGCAAGDFVLLTVADNGCGMDKDVIDMLFEPFYTTKETGHGSGLGLATIYGIVHQNNGFIKVDSKVGQGTTIRVYLPRYVGDGDRREGTEAGGGYPAGQATVLLVEDEPAILGMTREMLEKIGCNVLTATTPAEAVNRAGEYGGTINLLMTDVIMPEMNGWELSRKLQAIQPDLKLLFTSGYSADVIGHHDALEKAVHFIRKPFTLDDLAAKVGEALET
ncbi:transporter substrate-binding domain-containing protein [Desulfoprunum benzoelyticum]|uniref:histidine kinase n=1 Tax=Desulfoprunum benzoelyticum TaxID=1506996 RepID=A0A840UUF9_9BACT|nr:transporter substrate-binding domain-containing protein [Desulfoprunum benzoelyticum]MBB5348466.1 PAS domain S-box-containing protein [Desulfoprunum benzoelyticum]MBM9530199.1 transporter substrate-binding domain-containing protein [Desulfoprunum benzoelyticum]